MELEKDAGERKRGERCSPSVCRLLCGRIPYSLSYTVERDFHFGEEIAAEDIEEPAGNGTEEEWNGVSAVDAVVTTRAPPHKWH